MFGRTVGRTGRCITQQVRQNARQGRKYATEAPEPGSPRRTGTFGMTLYALAFTAIGAAGSWYGLKRRGLGFYSDEESLKQFNAGDDEARRAEETINSHPLVAELRARTDLTESRPHMKMPKAYRETNMTAGALMAPRRLVVPAYSWNDADGKEMISIAYAGEELCGHPGILHGGLLATMMDEGLVRCCMPALPHRVGLTANLNVNFRKPAPAGNFFVFRAETIKVEGRKGWTKGRIESLVKPGETPVVYAEGTALCMSPRYAALMPKVQ